MENKLTPELLEKAKKAKSAEELIALAKENGAQLSAEEANTYFAKLNSKTGELSDDELDNVAGGGCTDSGEVEVDSWSRCSYFVCAICNDEDPNCQFVKRCRNCKYARNYSNKTVCRRNVSDGIYIPLIV